MLRIEGKTVGGTEVSAHSEQDVHRIAEEGGKCRFTASCGCGQFHIEGWDGVRIWRAAEEHFKQTGHKCFGHFMFGKEV